MSASEFKDGDYIKATLGKNVLFGTIEGYNEYNSYYSFGIKIGTYVDDHGDEEDVYLDVNSDEGWTFEMFYELPTALGAVVSCEGQTYVRDGRAGGEFCWICLSDPATDYVNDSFFEERKFVVHFKGVDGDGYGGSEESSDASD